MAVWIKRFLPRTLFGRSLLIILVPLILLQAISATVFYERHWDTMTRRLAWSLAGDIAMLIDLLEPGQDADTTELVVDMARRHFDMRISYRIGDILPNTALEPLDDAAELAMADAMDEKVRRPFALETEALDRDLRILVQLPEGVLEVVTTRKRLYSVTTYIFILWMVGASLILFAIAVVFMRNQVRPIRRLAHAAFSFGLGRDVHGFRPEGATEVRQAAEAFIQMRDRIRRQIAQRTEMLAGVSHDLRTPITRMKLELAMMPESPAVADLRSDLAEMERMVEGYLAFARGEGGEATVEADLTSILADEVGNARRQGRQVELEVPDALRLLVRPNALRRAVANLIANACRFARKVAVAAVPGSEAVDVYIDDDGPGIPADRREEVFKPFFRLDPSRNPETGGIGLGLTIARDIVRSHGGELSLETSPLGGLRAHIRLPR